MTKWHVDALSMLGPLILFFLLSGMFCIFKSWTFTSFRSQFKCYFSERPSLTTQSKAASSLPPNHSIIFIFYCVNSSHISLLSSPICLLLIHTSFPNVSIIRLIQESMDPACLVCPEPHAYQIGRYSINHSCHYPFLSGLLLPQPMPNQVQ